MDCWNTAIAYLKKTYGISKGGSYKIPPKTDHQGTTIHLLLDQYYLGASAKKELAQTLKSLGL